MRQRIADDPDSWGKPEDLEKKKPLPADASAMSTCTKCGVMWHYHDSSVCNSIGDDGAYGMHAFFGLLSSL